MRSNMSILMGSALLFAALATPTLAAAPAPSPYRWNDAKLWQQSIAHSIDFFDRHAWDETSGSYATEVSIDGSHRSEVRHLIPVGRMIYGLAHGGRLDRARRLHAFFKANMVLEEDRPDAGPYFLASFDPSASAPAAPAGLLVVNMQAYGLCGMVALAQKTGDPTVRAELQRAADAFYRRFHDGGPARGFFDGYDLSTGQPVRTKSYNSTVYVATAFLAEMATDPAAKIGGRPCTEVLAELGDLISDHFFQDQTGWIVENFTADWKPDWRGWQVQEGKTIGVVGHSFQAAWLLMRLSLMPEIRSTSQLRYQSTARKILRSMLAKPVHDTELGGVYDVFERETNQPKWHTNKPWWQQCEAILACTLAQRMGLVRDRAVIAMRDRAVDFYFRHFVDRKGGGEFDVVTREGQPTGDTKKGTDGKSTYHTVEMARYMLLYGR